ncbi:MAG: stage II sporulation protein R [Clostridia bacterium]|nr:stage II sporulation protein R [Clostridia bacterium]
MRRLLTSAALFLLAALILPCLPLNDDAAIYDNVIRLHVIAASDSEADQATKLAVRDAILEKITPLVTDCATREAAQARIAAVSEEIAALADTTVSARGHAYTARVLLGTERYPTRTYESAALPSGEYLSLRVVLGEGEGQNWWCVLFPPLCQSVALGEDDAEERCIAAGLTPEQYRLITGGESGQLRYRVRFKLLELLDDVVGRLRQWRG